MVRAAAVLAALPFLNDRSGVFALSKRQRFQELSTQGQDAIILGDLPAANVSLTEALALKPSSSKTANDLGVVLLQWAIEEETSATRADPTVSGGGGRCCCGCCCFVLACRFMASAVHRYEIGAVFSGSIQYCPLSEMLCN